MAPVTSERPTEGGISPEVKKDRKKEEELSEEDQKLNDDLESLVEKLNEPHTESDAYTQSLTELKEHIRDSTTSMTAVPKPLKFLRPHFPLLTEVYEKWSTKFGADNNAVVSLADILSVLAMTYSDDGKRDSLNYRLLSSQDTIVDWGHEYLRHLALEIGEAYQENLGTDESLIHKLTQLSMKIVPYFLKHNAEADAVDLLLEIENIDKLPQFVDENTFARVCLYMVSCVPFLAPPDDLSFLNTAYTIYLSNNQWPQALTLAIKLDDVDLIKQVFNSTDDESIHKQLGFVLSQQYNNFDYGGENAEVQEAISNTKLHEYYSYLTKELNLLDPKTPEDIYKSHLEYPKYLFGSSGAIDSAKQNLAAAFVNGLLNFGFGSDKLVQTEEDNKSWIYKTKGQGMVSTTASLGWIHQWSADEGLQVLDKYTESTEDEVKAGALLGTGIVSSRVHDESDAAFALLQEYVLDPKKALQTSSIMGLGIAFSGTSNEDVCSLLLPLISDLDVSLEISCIAALSLGHVFVGTCNGEITSSILQALLEGDIVGLSSKYVKFMALGLGLLYMGKHEQIEDVLEAISAIEYPISKSLKVLVNICAYAGTGNVLQIQSLLQMCTAKPKDTSAEEKLLEQSEEDQMKKEQQPSGEENNETIEADGDVVMEDATEAPELTNAAAATAPTNTTANTEESKPKVEDKSSTEENEKVDEDEEEEDELYQGFAVLGLAIIAMGEDIGQDMSLRHFSHLMHYGNSLIRRSVPLAMGLVSASNPQMKVFDTLSRYSHDPDLEVAQNAIYAMGLVGAGTNNARLAQLLRQLAVYYIKNADTLFMVRIAQGILHLGKGTLTLNPFNTERSILSKASLASLLTIAVALLDPKDFILNDSYTEVSHQLLYFLTPAIQPRMLVTVDENLEPIKVNVRVGQAVDVVGQAGKPKTITGWVTQSTPVLLNYGERAELENTEEWISLSNSLEGITILKKNPDYMETDS